MRTSGATWTWALLFAGTATLGVAGEVSLVGTGSIAGNATDQSGLTGLLEDGVTPRNLVGGLGSAITYGGIGNLYLATPDRGPADGATSYVDRAYVVDLGLTNAAGGSVLLNPRVVGTVLLRSEKNAFYTGSAAAFDATGSSAGRRFDPEGVRVGRCGTSFFVSDEYGPYVYEFDTTGKRIRSVGLPTKFLADMPSATPADELTKNASGRQSNRGMEGMAISPDGSKLYGIMQSPLIQDGGLDEASSRVGTNNRILEIDVATGAVREFLYVLDAASLGISEILAVNDHEFLVLERDGRAGANARVKNIFKIDIAQATDIRAVKTLPEAGVPVDITPVAKEPFIDLLDPTFGLAGPTFPEKIEGLAFGPDLPDGRHALVVASDNDFVQTNPTRFFVFGIEPTALPDFAPQTISSSSCRVGGSRP